MKRNKPVILWLLNTIILLPIVVLVLWSFSNEWMHPNLIPASLTLKHAQMAVNDPAFWPAISNSIGIGLIATVITMIIGIPAAQYFAFHSHFSNKGLQILIYIPLILPAIAVITSVHIGFIQLGLASSYLGVILIHVYYMLPYALQILVASYTQVGLGYAQTAKALGAKRFQIWLTINYPLLKPGISTAAMLVFIISFSQYLPTFFIGGGQIITFPMILLPYANNGRFSMASIYSLIFLLTALIMTEIIKQAVGRRYHERKY